MSKENLPETCLCSLTLRSQRSWLSPWSMLQLRKAGRGSFWQRGRECYFGEAFPRVCHMHTHLSPGLWPEPPPSSLFPVSLSRQSVLPTLWLPEESFQMCSYLVSLFAYLFMVSLFRNYVNCMREETLLILFTTLYPRPRPLTSKVLTRCLLASWVNEWM